MIEIDEARIKDHVNAVVRGSVEDTLNALLDAEADRLRHIAGTQWGTKRYLRMDLLRDLDAPETLVA